MPLIGTGRITPATGAITFTDKTPDTGSATSSPATTAIAATASPPAFDLSAQTLGSGFGLLGTLDRTDNSFSLSLRSLEAGDNITIVEDHGALRISSTASGGGTSSAPNMGVIAAGTGALDCSLGSYFTKTISANTTFSFTNPPSVSATTGAFQITLALSNGGAATLTWPGNVRWPNGFVPTFTASGLDIVTFLTLDGGTNWLGALTHRNVL